MASTITNYSNLIDDAFPVAGQDNDSQGFRNNFSKIKVALSTAAEEITDLQVSSVSLNSTNDFGNNILKRAALQGSSQITNDGGAAISTGTNVDYALGSYHMFTVQTGTTYTFNVSNWPPVGYLGTVRIELTPNSTTGTFVVGFGGPVNYLAEGVNGPVTHACTSPIKPVVWELFSPDNGSKILAYQLK